MDLDEVCSAYWTYYELAFSSDRDERLRSARWAWASDLVDEVGDGERTDLAVEPLRVFEALAESAPDGEALGYLGAGPIENYLSLPSWDLDEVISALRTNAALREAFRCAHPPQNLSTARRQGLQELLGGDPPS